MLVRVVLWVMGGVIAVLLCPRSRPGAHTVPPVPESETSDGRKAGRGFAVFPGPPLQSFRRHPQEPDSGGGRRAGDPGPRPATQPQGPTMPKGSDYGDATPEDLARALMPEPASAPQDQLDQEILEPRPEPR